MSQYTAFEDLKKMDKVKTMTVKLPGALHFNLGIYTNETGKEKKEVIREALTAYLKSLGIPDPQSYPTMEWSDK